MKKRVGRLLFHKGSKLWAVRVDGKMKYFPREIQTREQAELEVSKIRVRLSSEPTDRTKDDETVETLVGLYLDAVRGTTSDRNHRDKTRIMEAFVKRYGKRTLKSLLPLEVVAFINDRPSRTSGAGKRQVYAFVKAWLNWCAAMLRTTSNPLTGIKRAKARTRSEEFVIRPDEWAMMRPLIPQPYLDVADVLWWTGARPSEVLSATVEELDRIGRALRKKHHKTENKGQTRIILLNEEALEIVNRHIGGRTEGYIFDRSECRFSQRYLNELIIKAAIGIGRTKPTCCYSLRHSFICRNILRGVSITIVASWVGHSPEVCARVYAHTVANVAETRHLME